MTTTSIYRSQIMKSAWKVARAGAAKFGGSVRSYLAAALKDAWNATKANPYAKETARIIAEIKMIPASTAMRRDRLVYRTSSFFNPW